MSFHHNCDWCNQHIRHNPFTRNWLDEVRLYCSQKCMDDHRDYEDKVRDYQARFNFDVVV